MTGDIILQSQPYPVQGNTNKAISYNTARAIFLSKKEGGQMESVLDMNGHYITNIRDPVNTDHGVNKKYVDNEIAKITTVDTNQFVLKSGSTMTGDLDMDSNFVRNVGIDLADKTAAMPKSYIDASLANVIAYPITSDINMSDKKITNLKSPEGDNDAVNREFLNQQISISHIETSDKTNQFKYLNDPVQLSSERNIVNAFNDWINSPHKYNKRAYDVTLQRHSGADNYNSVLGINLYSARAGKFTLVFEFHTTEMSNISITSIASTATINKQTQRNFINHTKVITQVDNSSLQTSDYLGIAAQATVKAHIIIYGVCGWVDNIDSSIYDDVFYYLDEMFDNDNGNMKMKKNINLDNHKINNLEMVSMTPML